jgi:hypothetical protein
MPFSNFTELQDSIRAYLVQSDIEDKVQDFIKLTESRFNREVRCREMVNIDTGSLYGAQAFDLPSGFIEAVEGWRVTLPFPGGVTQYVPPARFFTLGSSNVSGVPRIHTMVGNQVYFAPDPTDAEEDQFPYVLDYYARIQPLTTTNSSNWMLEKYPDLYLYGSLLEAEPFIVNDARMATWEKLYERGRNSLTAADARSRYRPGGVMRPESRMNDGKAWRY